MAILSFKKLKIIKMPDWNLVREVQKEKFILKSKSWQGLKKMELEISIKKIFLPKMLSKKVVCNHIWELADMVNMISRLGTLSQLISIQYYDLKCSLSKKIKINRIHFYNF
jgi:hypothetical protein